LCPEEHYDVVMDKLTLVIVGLTSLVVGGHSLQSTARAAPQVTARQALVEPEVNAQDGMKYVSIAPGTFQMGCSEGDNDCTPGEKPAHTVTLTKGFWIAQTEVTVQGYKRFVRSTGRAMPPEPEYSGRSPITLRMNPGWADDQQPIVDVTWHDAGAYCAWAGGRLPTEAEWEYAARAGEKRSRYGNPDDIAWYAENSGRSPLNTVSIRAAGGNIREIMPLMAPNGNRPHRVAQKTPNVWGLFDMLGNVHEWVADWYGQYQESPSTNTTGPETGERRVVRGGEYLRQAATITAIELSFLFHNPPSLRR
jgi:formylglycine-generating enzyme required for sulfatase activity